MIRPTSEQIQTFLNETVRTVVNVSKQISQWNEFGKKTPEESVENESEVNGEPLNDQLATENELSGSISEIEHETSSISLSDPTGVTNPNGETSFRDSSNQSSIGNENQSARGRANTSLGPKETNSQQNIAVARVKIVKPNNLFKFVAENKEISKLISLLSTSIIALRNVSHR